MRPLDNPDPPLSRIITEYNTRKTKKNISALTKLLFIVALSASSGVLAQIHRNDNVILLYLMVIMICRINLLVFDLAVTTWCIFSTDISFFSYVFFLNKNMAVDKLAEDQSYDIDLNKVRKLCCA